MYYFVISFACAVGLLGFAQFMTADSAAAHSFDGETTAQSLNVRTGPGTTHKVVATVPHGTPVSILEIDDGWARVTATSPHGALDGWVSGKYVDVYEFALPEVASAGLEEEADELPALSQPVAEQEIAVADAPAEQPETASVEVESEKLAESAASETQEEAAPLSETLLTDKIENAATEETEQVVASLDTTPTPEIPVEQPTETLNLKSVDAAEPAAADVQVSSLETNTDAQPVTANPDQSALEAAIGPATFEALGLSCRQGYFSDGLEACTADIKVDVTVPAELAGLISNPLNVTCDVGYSYESNGSRLEETTSDAVQVTLNKGQGSAVLESRIDFLYRVEGVKRVEIGDINCEAASE